MTHSPAYVNCPQNLSFLSSNPHYTCVCYLISSICISHLLLSILPPSSLILLPLSPFRSLSVPQYLCSKKKGRKYELIRFILLHSYQISIIFITEYWLGERSLNNSTLHCNFGHFSNLILWKYFLLIVYTREMLIS